MDQKFIHMPWQAESQMNFYPMPIIDEKIARKKAIERIYNLRKNDATHREIAKKIFSKHGSRKSSAPRRLGNKITKNNAQKEFPL